jgi:hypothetical protein
MKVKSNIARDPQLNFISTQHAAPGFEAGADPLGAPSHGSQSLGTLATGG